MDRDEDGSPSTRRLVDADQAGLYAADEARAHAMARAATAAGLRSVTSISSRRAVAEALAARGPTEGQSAPSA